MWRARLGICLALNLTLAAAAPRRAAALDGSEVLTWSLVGAGVGALLGLIGALAQGKPSKSRAAQKKSSLPVTSTSPATRTPLAPSELTSQAIDLQGIKLSWHARPNLDPSKVRLRLQRYVQQPAATPCAELELRIDGAERRFPLDAQRSVHATVTQETLTAETDIEQVRVLRAAQRVEFRLCELTRPMTLSGSNVTASFVNRFDAQRRAAKSAP